FFFQAEDGIRDRNVTGVQTCALPISGVPAGAVVSFSEQTPGEVIGATWHDAVIDPGTVTIEADDVVTVTVTNTITADDPGEPGRSEERRVGKECRTRW